MIRNTFGLWQGNTALIKDALGEDGHPDCASQAIIELFYDRLNKEG